jgi:arylsulfatase
MICFFSDHGDHLGDHHGWQKESFFEASAHVPFLVSWPGRIEAGVQREQLAALTDLFGLATGAAGKAELRQGCDLLPALTHNGATRESLFGYYGVPGTPQYKIMVRHEDWKYIYLANGGREQLFDVRQDRAELHNLASTRPEIARKLRGIATEATNKPELAPAMDGSALRAFAFQARPQIRIYQFDRSRGIKGFPQHPREVLSHWQRKPASAAEGRG